MSMLTSPQTKTPCKGSRGWAGEGSESLQVSSITKVETGYHHQETTRKSTTIINNNNLSAILYINWTHGFNNLYCYNQNTNKKYNSNSL